MGCHFSRGIKSYIINIHTSTQVLPTRNEVDLALEESKLQEKFIFKILLLGAGESGKSTVIKQIKMLYKNNNAFGSTANIEREMKECVTSIRRNVLEAIHTLIEASNILEISVKNPETVDAIKVIEAVDINADLTTDLADLIHKIWKDEDIQLIYSRRDEFWHMDATPYYMEEIFRLADPDFEPTDEDVVMTRVRKIHYIKHMPLGTSPNTLTIRFFYHRVFDCFLILINLLLIS